MYNLNYITNITPTYPHQNAHFLKTATRLLLVEFLYTDIKKKKKKTHHDKYNTFLAPLRI